MRQRSISAVGVVLVGIVPALFGGPVWTALLIGIGLISLSELRVMSRGLGRRPLRSGYLVLPVIVVSAAFRPGGDVLLGLLSLIVLVSFTEALTLGNAAGSALDWAMDCANVAYLAIPLGAAATLRGIDGEIDSGWLHEIADTLSLGWDAAPRGLAWLLFVIVVTWLSDTGAYLVGRAVGRRPLAPTISPKKTVEGLLGGYLFAGIAAVAASAAFGLDFPWWAIALGTITIASIGVVGDLSESLLKRQAGVKDSGRLIPGHGGMLDRIDALLFAWSGGLLLAVALDRVLVP